MRFFWQKEIKNKFKKNPALWGRWLSHFLRIFQKTFFYIMQNKGEKWVGTYKIIANESPWSSSSTTLFTCLCPAILHHLGFAVPWLRLLRSSTNFLVYLFFFFLVGSDLWFWPSTLFGMLFLYARTRWEIFLVQCVSSFLISFIFVSIQLLLINSLSVALILLLFCLFIIQFSAQYAVL